MICIETEKLKRCKSKHLTRLDDRMLEEIFTQLIDFRIRVRWYLA